MQYPIVNERQPERAILLRLPQLRERWRRAEISDAVYATFYFLYWQMARHGHRFASRRSRFAVRPDFVAWLQDLDRATGADLTMCLIDYLNRYSFREITSNVSTTLTAWLQNHWSLAVYDHIPSPTEVLGMQAKGSRPVTVLASYPRLLQPVLNKADAFAFMVHDLEHAYKFFCDDRLNKGQRAFFFMIERAGRQGLFDAYLEDPEFARGFDYLISDMNTHMIHSLHYLRAILIELLLRKEGKVSSDALSTEGRQALCELARSLAACLGLCQRSAQTLSYLFDGISCAAHLLDLEEEFCNVCVPGDARFSGATATIQVC